jgi:hypothetical protein
MPIPDAHLAGGQRGLALLRCRCRVGGFGERVKEGIPLRVYLDTTVALEGVTKDPAVLAQNLAVAIAEFLKQARRTLDVGEHQGDRPGWQSAACHRWSLRAKALIRQHCRGQHRFPRRRDASRIRPQDVHRAHDLTP